MSKIPSTVHDETSPLYYYSGVRRTRVEKRISADNRILSKQLSCMFLLKMKVVENVRTHIVFEDLYIIV